MLKHQNASKSRRKKILIYPQFQIRFLISSIGSALTVTLIYFASNYYFFHHFEQIGIDGGLPMDHVFFRFIDQQKNLTSLLVVVMALASTIVLTMYGLIQSNKIAGPMVRLKKYLEDEINGSNTQPLSFRENDYFKEIADLVNKAIAKKSR